MKSHLSTNSGHIESKILTFSGGMSEYIVATFESRNLLLLLKAGGIGMGKTCEPKAFPFQCMTKFTTNKKNKQTKQTNNNKKKAVKKHLLDVRREPTIGHVKGEKQLELCT